jgi:hypothetical protein
MTNTVVDFFGVKQSISKNFVKQQVSKKVSAPSNVETLSLYIHFTEGKQFL